MGAIAKVPEKPQKPASQIIQLLQWPPPRFPLQVLGSAYSPQRPGSLPLALFRRRSLRAFHFNRFRIAACKNCYLFFSSFSISVSGFFFISCFIFDLSTSYTSLETAATAPTNLNLASTSFGTLGFPPLSTLLPTVLAPTLTLARSCRPCRPSTSSETVSRSLCSYKSPLPTPRWRENNARSHTFREPLFFDIIPP